MAYYKLRRRIALPQVLVSYMLMVTIISASPSTGLLIGVGLYFPPLLYSCLSLCLLPVVIPQHVGPTHRKLCGWHSWCCALL